MDRKEIIDFVGEWFGADRNAEGEYDMESYDFQTGSVVGGAGQWLNLATVCDMIEELINERG